MKKKIPSAVVRRLPKYFRQLTKLEEDGVLKISSNQLSEITGFTASQIRQDLNHFGGFGQQGYGYKTSELKNSIKEILGLEEEYKAIIIGYGHIGSALHKYSGFESKKFEIKAIFDLEEYTKEDGTKIKSIKSLDEYLSANEVDLVILTVPKENASVIAKQLEGKNIKGVWNFAPIELVIDEGKVPVENIHLSESLYTLMYYMGNPEQY